MRMVGTTVMPGEFILFLHYLIPSTAERGGARRLSPVASAYLLKIRRTRSRHGGLRVDYDGRTDDPTTNRNH